MSTSRLTSRGQVTVPKELRDALDWKPGDTIEFVRFEHGVRMMRRRRWSIGEAIVERLRRAPWNPRLTTDRLMNLTRG